MPFKVVDWGKQGRNAKVSMGGGSSRTTSPIIAVTSTHTTATGYSRIYMKLYYIVTILTTYRKRSLCNVAPKIRPSYFPFPNPLLLLSAWSYNGRKASFAK